ncbi:unnamed protein product [Phytomonas sp. Hart1]|nr:unnamed protein product [Phytomonas sp. Hart1]|eukprot:CCW70261.1 unnamed protein product [Phytomonas sp. isolate Hart1]
MSLSSMERGHKAVKLTSKNLFDSVFSAIPADVSINYNSNSLLEALPIMKESDIDVSSSAAGIDRAAPGEGENGEDILLRDEGDVTTLVIGPDRLRQGMGVRMTALQTTSIAGLRVGSLDGHAPGAQVSHSNQDPGVVKFELDLEDEAIKVATRHAEDLSEYQRLQREVEEEEMAVYHARDRQGQVGHSLTGKDREEGSGGVRRHHGQFARGNRLREDESTKGSKQNPNAGLGIGTGGEEGEGSTGPVASSENPSMHGNGEACGGKVRPYLTPEEQLRNMPPGLNRLYRGHCVMLRQSRGFGFLAPELGGPDVYFTLDGVRPTFSALALAAFHMRRGGAVPPSVAAVLQAAPLIEEGRREGEGLDLTAEEREKASEAAALLSPDTARLLQYHFDCVKGGTVMVKEALTFTVQRNRTVGGGSRLLRADFIRGLPENAYATQTEQAWFWPLFPKAVGRKITEEGPDNAHDTFSNAGKAADGVVPTDSLKEGGADLKAPSPKDRDMVSIDGEATVKKDETKEKPHTLAQTQVLVRYLGTVRTYDTDERRGYIRCDELGDLGVFFYAEAVLWGVGLAPPQRRIMEGMRVQYSVANRDRNRKYLATLITSIDGRPFSLENIHFTENLRGSSLSGSGGPTNDSDVTGVGAQSHFKEREIEDLESRQKRQREEDNTQLLLFEEDDYAVI